MLRGPVLVVRRCELHELHIGLVFDVERLKLHSLLGGKFLDGIRRKLFVLYRRDLHGRNGIGELHSMHSRLLQLLGRSSELHCMPSW